MRGNANEQQCIHILKKQVHELSQEASSCAEDTIVDDSSVHGYAQILKGYINELATIDTLLMQDEE